MVLSAGSKLGPYEILAPLGAGGMGEVYRARDSRIGRDVAVKILPEEFASSPDRLQRFAQEARAAGILNHPNLLTIFDLGIDGPTPYIVSELLEGHTLRDRLPLPQRKAIEYALQIAAGVAAAHDGAIVHRDLKPENIFVTADDRIKLLDFGLAKVLRDPSKAHATSTIVKGTDPGTVMGTAEYMSPEQVRGEPIDHRTDIFSLGSILFEMLTGARPFHRQSTVETMNAILNDDVSFPSTGASAALQRVVLHALEKNRVKRFQSIRDLAFALEAFSGSHELAAVTTKGKLKRATKPVERPLPTFVPVTFRRGFVNTARFARDGSVVYGAAWEDLPIEIFASIPGDPQARPLGVIAADVLSVSPTTGELAISLGRHFIGGWASTGTLARLSPSGGAPREILEDMQDADWSADGKSLAVIRRSGELFTIEYPIGKRIFTTAHWISHVRLSPKNDLLAFVDHPLWGDDAGSMMVIDLHGEIRATSSVSRSAGGISWTPAGDEVLISAIREAAGRDLIAVNLHGKERTVFSMPGRLNLHDINPAGEILASIDLGRREILAGRHSAPGERNLSWCDWSFLTDIAPDGSRIAFIEQANAARGSLGSIYVRQIDGSHAVHLGDGHGRTFSPDGKWIASMGERPDHLDLLPVGAGEPRSIPVRGLEMMSWWYWMPDGKRLLLWGNQPKCGCRVFELLVDGDGTVRPITPEGVKWPIAISPDAAWAALTSPSDRLMMYSIAGDEEPREVPGSRPGDQAVTWGTDGALYIYRIGRVSTVIERIDLQTGARAPWQELKPDPVGVMNIQPVVVSANLDSYAYGYRRFLSELHIIKGLL